MRSQAHPSSSRLLALAVLVVGFMLTACETDPINSAENRLVAGDYDAVLVLLEGRAEPHARLLKGKALIGQSKYRLAMEELSSSDETDTHERATEYSQLAVDAFIDDFVDLLATKDLNSVDQSMKLLEFGGELAGRLDATEHFAERMEAAISDAAEAYDNRLAQHLARHLEKAQARDRAFRTMADLRSLGTAIESFSIDNNVYPEVTNINTLADLVEPVYIGRAPRKDGWGRLFLVTSRKTEYTICSGGQDGGGCYVSRFGGPSTDLNDAIVFSNGRFVQWPE